MTLDAISEAKDAGRFEVGHVVAERYEILDAIGCGASGNVYRARDLYVDNEHEIVALKAIHERLHGDRQIFGRFRREVKILRRLEGPHLCKLLEYIEDDGLLMIALEYVDGPSLDSYLKEQGPLPLSEVVAIMTQICSALSSAHANDVIHRDLKPSNVLIEGVWRDRGSGDEPAQSFLNDLKVRVVDFGLAKMVTGELTGTVLTEQDMVFGTPDYMAPEQVTGEELDGRCDIYAAGVMLFEMVTGSVPFDTPGPLTTMTAHINDAIPKPSGRAPERDIPPALDRVIMKALAKRPDDRFQTADELAEALQRLDDDDAPASDVEATSLEHAQTAIGTTLQSHKDEALGSGEQKGAKVRVVVRSAAPPSSVEPSSRPAVTSAPTPGAIRRRGDQWGGTGDDERRLWVIVAVVIMAAAVALGIWLGLAP